MSSVRGFMSYLYIYSIPEANEMSAVRGFMSYLYTYSISEAFEMSYVRGFMSYLYIYRIPEADEMSAVRGFMKQIYSCDITSLPKPAFLHEYALNWRKVVPRMEEYANCSRKVAVTSKCFKYISRFCGKRFRDGIRRNNMPTCKAQLWEQGNNIRREKETLTGDVRNRFKTYAHCVERDIGKLETCVPMLDRACKGSPVRAMKTVRATMDEVEPLLNADPDFRLLHLYRDPRAVYWSRRKNKWTWSHFETMHNRPWKTAHVYCQTVLHDYKKRKELETKYPGRIKSIVYDSLMLDPYKSRREIHAFLGMSAQTDPGIAVNRTTLRKLDPRSVTNQFWKTNLTETNVNDLEQACQELADIIGVKWRNSPLDGLKNRRH